MKQAVNEKAEYRTECGRQAFEKKQDCKFYKTPADYTAVRLGLIANNYDGTVTVGRRIKGQFCGKKFDELMYEACHNRFRGCRKYAIFNDILKEENYFSKLAHMFLGKQCRVCGRKRGRAVKKGRRKMYKCKRCMSVYYCCRAHQKMDYLLGDHKSVCFQNTTGRRDWRLTITR